MASSFSSDEALQLNISIMKDLTDFRKTVETGVDPRLDIPVSYLLAGKAHKEYFKPGVCD